MFSHPPPGALPENSTCNSAANRPNFFTTKPVVKCTNHTFTSPVVSCHGHKQLPKTGNRALLIQLVMLCYVIGLYNGRKKKKASFEQQLLWFL